MSLDFSCVPLRGDGNYGGGRYWKELSAALEEPNPNYHKASLAVIKLMVLVVHELDGTCEHVCLQFRNLALRSVFAGLRALTICIRTRAKFAVNQWRISFEHPAVAFIFSQAIGTLVESMREARCDEHNVQLVLRLFRDNMARREPEIRKQLESGEFGQ